MKKHTLTNRGLLIFSLAIIGVLVLSACGPSATPTPAPTQDIALIQTQAAQTVVADMTKNAPPPPTQAPSPTAPPTMAPAPGPTPDPNLPVAIVPTPAPGEPGLVANFSTTINSGPGTNYVVYTILLTGRSAKIVGKSDDGQWWAVSVPVAPLGSGWVSASWVTASNADGVPVLPTPPVPPTVEPIPPAPTDPQAMALANVYVRSGPATIYPAYGIALKGATARVIGKSEDGQWWVVRLNPQNVGVGYGWVNAQYTLASNVDNVLTIKNPTPFANIPLPPPASGVPTAMAVDYVNVRTGPGTNYPILGVAPPGATAQVSGKSSDGAWWQVMIPTQYSSSGFGWVSASYVITQNTSNVPVVSAPTPPPYPTATPLPTTGCSLVSQSPADGTKFNPGAGFSTTWVLKNTSGSKWDQNEVDIRYVGAEANVQLHQGADIYDLVATVQPGNTYNFSVPMIAPFDQGTYGELWEVAMSNKTICQFYVYIQVPTSGNAPAPTNTPAAPTSTSQAPTSTAPAPTNTVLAPTETSPAPTGTPAPVNPVATPPTATPTPTP